MTRTETQPPYLRLGRHQHNNLYRGDVYIGVMFRQADAEFIRSAVNYYLDHLSTMDSAYRDRLAQRHAERDLRRHKAADQADRVGRSIACQHPDFAVHGTKCIGIRAAMNNGMGCLCPCHDNDLIPPKEGA